MKYLSLLLIVCCNLSDLLSQSDSRKKYSEDSARIIRPRLVRPQLKFDNRLTFFMGKAVTINGFDAGVLLKDKMRLTLGYYRLKADLDPIKETVNNVEYATTIASSYGALNTEIIYFNRRYLSLGMPLEIAVGNNEKMKTNLSTQELSSDEAGLLSMAHFGLSATFKPIRWIGLKGMAGYRKTIFTQVKTVNFDGVFTSIGLNIDVQEIIRDVRMINLKRKYRKGNNIENAVDLITD